MVILLAQYQPFPEPASSIELIDKFENVASGHMVLNLQRRQVTLQIVDITPLTTSYFNMV